MKTLNLFVLATVLLASSAFAQRGYAPGVNTLGWSGWVTGNTFANESSARQSASMKALNEIKKDCLLRYPFIFSGFRWQDIRVMKGSVRDLRSEKIKIETVYNRMRGELLYFYTATEYQNGLCY